MTIDDRMTPSLFPDVLDVPKRHGYHQHDRQHAGQAIGVIHDLAHLYEGAHDTPSSTYPGQAPPSAPPEPRPPLQPADPDAVILTGTEITTVPAAPDLAADDERDRAGMCADRADQTRPTCQSRLQAARADDHLATQILQTAETQSAQRDQPGPGSPSLSPGRADPAAGLEAGQ